MDTPQLEYAGPRTPRLVRSRWPWLDIAMAVGLLLAIAFLVFTPKFGSNPGKEAAAATDVSMLDQALARFRRDVGRRPTDAEGLDALVNAPDPAEPWLGPYFKRGETPTSTT